jgi:tripartite-type tricarboxylate transporter receptor subunit TctC
MAQLGARLAAGAATFLGVLMGPQIAAYAQTPAEFYKGNKFSVVIGYSVGGGYDQYARLLSRHIGRHIPGAPTVIVQNAPGAGSLTALRRLEGNLPKDGTVVVTFNPFLISEAMFAPEKVGVDFRAVQWIGSIMRNSTICFAWHGTGIRDWSDLLKRDQFVIGATGKGTSSYTHSSLLREIFGVKVRQILGFPGSSDKQLAMERGELDGECGAWTSLPPEMIRDKKYALLVRFTPVRVAGMPDDMPFAGDLAKSDEHKAILDIIAAPGELGRPFIMSSAVPADRVAAVRGAFAVMTVDPAFLAEAEKLHMPLSIVGHAEATAAVKRIYSFPREYVEKAAKMVE